MKAPEKQPKAKTGKQENATEPENLPSELRAGVWSVISFDKREAAGLTYPQAEQKLSELEAAKTPGLCIVPDDVGARIAARNSETGA